MRVGPGPGGDPRGADRDVLRNNGVVKLTATLKPRESAGVDPVPEDQGRHRVAASLVTAGPGTAATLSERLGISTTAVRRHLDSLVADGLVEASDRPPFGPSPARGRGRPARSFWITPAGRSQFPSDYDELAVAAISFLAETAGDQAVVAFADARAAALEAGLRRRLGSHWAAASIADKSQALAEALSELGYAAGIEPAPGGTQICQHHCPVSHVAEQYPQLCEAETDAFARLLGHHVQRLATIAHGDGVCTTVIPSDVIPAERTTA
jgi:predicted ArsR family transcriptional regulator